MTDILVLTPEDVSYIPPRLWTELEPGVILWNSIGSSPFTAYLYTTSTGRVEMIADGDTLWKKSRK